MMEREYAIIAPDGREVIIVGPEKATKEQLRAAAENAFKRLPPLEPSETRQETSAPQESFGRKMLGPTVQALGAVGGGAIGVPLGPAGMVGGAGLGYGIANQFLNLYDQWAGTKEPPKTVREALEPAAKDVLEGATWEAGGRVAAPLFAKGVGKLLDWAKTPFSTGHLSKVKAGQIAREAAGPDIEALRDAVRNAPAGMTPAQATANINSPTWQALAERSAVRDPRFFGAPKSLTPNQQADALDALQRFAAGRTQTEVRASSENAVKSLNDMLMPARAVELNAANTAGRLKPKLEGEAQRMADAAASKVEDVRRFMAAQERAGQRAHTTVMVDGKPVAAKTSVPGYPRQPGRYTYMGELEKKAEQVAAKAADASLPFGEASRFAKAAADSLEAHGLRPLSSDPIVGNLKSLLADPDFAGNNDVKFALKRLAKDVAEWTGNGGVLDAYALDAIRKNSVNGAIQRLYPAADKNQQKALASEVMRSVKPIFVGAIERAGGTGYGDYLRLYSEGRQAVSQGKMAGELLDMFKKSPKTFADVVEGNAPEKVEKIFGPGKYDISRQMNETAMRPLFDIADLVSRTQKAGEQATVGQEALTKILESNISKWKIPWGLSPKTMAANQALGRLEHKIGTNTMNTLAQAFKSGKGVEEILATLPAVERRRVLSILNNPESWSPGISAGVFAGGSEE